MTDRITPAMAEAMVRVLRACGCDVRYPVDQHCCGLVALNSGDRRHGREMAEQTIRVLEATEADWVVTTSTSCLAAMLQDYQHLFRYDESWRTRAALTGRGALGAAGSVGGGVPPPAGGSAGGAGGWGKPPGGICM